MPELPEVETVRRGLEKLVLDKKVKKVDVLYEKMIVGDAKEFADKLTGQTIEKIGRRGKYLLFYFSNDLTMISHLRMEGKYYVKKPTDELSKHTHVIFWLDDGTQLRYNDVRKFGRMQLVKTGTEEQVSGLTKLGPEPTEKDFDANTFYKQLQKKKKNIKTALLDQTLVTGLGNIYVDEVLWQSKIHPLTACQKLTLEKANTLHDNIISELDKAIKAGGTTIRSYTDAFQKTGNFQFELDVYGRAGEPCRRCQTKIEKIVVGQRGTHFCPKCQQVVK